MKVSATQDTSFKPVTLTITLESQRELDALYHVGNLSSYLAEKFNEYHDGHIQQPATGDNVDAVLFSIWRELENMRTGQQPLIAKSVV